MSSRSYVMVAGNVGACMSVFSQVGHVYMSFTTDDVICDNSMNQRIMDMTTKNILEEISQMEKEKSKD